MAPLWAAGTSRQNAGRFAGRQGRSSVGALRVRRVAAQGPELSAAWNATAEVVHTKLYQANAVW